MPTRLPVLRDDDPAEEWTGDTRSCPPPDEPCVWVRCRHHALSDVSAEGVLRIAGKALPTRANRAMVARYMARAVRMIDEADVTCTLEASGRHRWLDQDIAEQLWFDVTTIRRWGAEGVERMRDPLAAKAELEPMPEGWRCCRRCQRPFEGDGIMCSQRCRAKARLEAVRRHEGKRGKRSR